MRSAIDVRTKELVDADEVRVGARHRVYACPACGARVHYKRSIGLSPDPIFAHNPHEGSPDCENYYPGQGGYGVPSPSSLTVRARPEVEDAPMEFGLCLEDAARWNLYLRIPEVSTTELRNISPRALTTAFVEVESPSYVNRLPLVDLRSGTGSSRLTVPPAKAPYKVTTKGAWPPGLDQKRWHSIAHGLNALGTIFRFRHGEWVRLRENTPIEFGEELRVVADQRHVPPTDCNPQARGVITLHGESWRMWSIEIPEMNLKRVANWAELLGFELVEPVWDVVLASIPEAINVEDGSFIYPTRHPIIVRLRPPQFSSHVDVALKSGSSRQSNTVSSPGGSDAAFLSISVPWPSSNELVIDYDNRATLQFETRDPCSILDLKKALLAVPLLRLKIGEMEVRSWSDPVDITLPRTGSELPRIEILPHLDDLRLNVEWSGETEGLRDELTREAALRLIRSLIEDGKGMHVRIDAGGLGRINFRFCAPANKKGISNFARRAEWLSAAVRNSVRCEGSMLPTAAIRMAANSGPRLRSAARSVDARWRAVMLRMLKDQTG